MARLLAFLSHLAIVVAVYRCSHSVSGFLVTGLGFGLLADRYVLRLLPWATPVAWTREVCVRFGYFLLGAAGFYVMRLGIVPLWEAAHRGMIVSLVAVLVETAVGWVPRPKGSHLAPAGRRGLWVRLTFLGLFGLMVPVVATLHPLHTVPKRTPGALGLAYEDVRFRTFDGVELAGWLVPHPHARGNVIFCHGHGRNRGHVAGLLETLHDMGLNVLAFDFRGHGDSEGHTSTFGQREVRDLVAAETYLSRRFPAQPLFLVGISLGAAVSLQALPQLPSVQGVWSEGAFSRFQNVVDTNLKWLPSGLQRPLAWMYDGLGWLDCGFWAPGVNPVDCLKGITVPICFCHGEHDELVPFDEGKALYTSYAGPKWHYWAEGATHYNVRQEAREEYLRRLRTFLEAHLLAGHAGTEIGRVQILSDFCDK
jgi:pimeloyl-ACP methyl ester carboxylesterase